jgi:hypothetical protein
MAKPNVILKSFFNDKGLDLRSSDLNREAEYASGMLNSDYRKTGALNKRKGFKAKTTSVGGFGEGTYSNVNLTTGVITKELVVVDSKLHKLVENTLTLTYSGSDDARFSVYYDSADALFRAVLTVDEVEVLNAEMGIGINETSPYAISSLVTAIDALADFTAVGSGATTSPGAFLDVTESLKVTSTGVSVKYYSYTAINTPLASPLATAQTNKNSVEFQNAVMVNLQNVLYVATGYDELHKYDGQTFYRAGMPAGTAPSTALGASTGITDTNINYIQTYVQKDAKGNLIEGIASSASGNLTPANQDINVTLTNILASTGFNTNCGIVNGTQVSVNTITVDSGHTLQVGDTAYFRDAISASYVERAISAITATTIVVAGNAVTVADNAVISNNLRIAIFRNTNGGSTYALVVEIPNNSLSATQIYNDALVTASLGAEYTPPVKPHGLPPKGRYLTAFRNQLIVTGDLANVNSFYWSEPGECEYFPSGDNSEDAETERGDKISGVSTLNNALYIFKDQSIHVVSGNLVDGQYRIDEVLGGDVGCVSHHTIAQIKGKLVFLGLTGVFALSNGDKEPEEISFKVEPLITKTDNDYSFSKSLAINWSYKNKYILYIPVEEADGSSNKYATSDSLILVFDYSRGAWLQWDSLNFMGGMALLDKSLFFSERRLDTNSDTTKYHTNRIQDEGSMYDYADHTDAITWNHKAHWETMGEPDVKKKFLRVSTFALDETIQDFEQESFTMTMEIESNYTANDPVSSSDLDFAPESGGWADFAWGDAAWGSQRKLKLMSKLKSFLGKSMRVVYSNEVIHENVLLTGWSVEVAAPYAIKIKK